MTTKEGTSGSSDKGKSIEITQVNDKEVTEDTDTTIKLDKVHEKIINEQVRIEDDKSSYFQLYSFAKKSDWLLMTFGLFSAAIAGAAVPVMTILFGQMVDSFTKFQTKQISGGELSNEVNKFVLYFIYLAILTFFANYFTMACWAATGERITRRIRENYLRATLRQNIAYFDKLGAGEVTTRITNDTHLIQDGISEKVSMAFSFFIQFITSFIIAFVTNWKLSLVIFCLLPLMILNGGIFSKLTVKYKNKILNYYSNAAVIAEEAISTIRTMVAFSQQKNISKLYETKLELAKIGGIRISTLNGLSLGMMNFIIYLTYSLAFWYGSILISKGEATPGNVVNVFFAVLIGSFALGHMVPDLVAFNNAKGAGIKIFATINRISPIDIESTEGNTLDKVEGQIHLKNVTFIYPSRPEIKTLKNVSLDIEPGTTVALVGSSGSGKSTIVSLLLRFYDPIEGEILVDGHNIKDLNLKWLRRQMSLVGQEPVLFNTTIAGNVAHGLIGSNYENIDKDKKHELIVQACKMANAHDFIMSLTDKYETMVGERGFLLSGGQKQRIAIARAIVKDPKILLLDEATSALDTQSEGIVQDALDKASKDRTTVVIAHRLSTIRNASKIIVMSNGGIVESGTHNELIQNPEGTYSRLVSLQEIQQKDSNDNSYTASEDYSLSKIITNKSSKSAIATEQTDIEKGLAIDYKYTAWELFRKVGKINRPEWYLVFIGLIASIVCGLVFPVFAILFGKVLNAFAKPVNELPQEARFWSLMFTVIAVAVLIASFVQGLCFGISGEHLSLRIRAMFFAAMLRQDISFFDKGTNNVGSLTSSLSTTATDINGLAGITLGTLLQVFATIISGLIVALVVGWKLTVVVMAMIPPMLVAGYYRFKLMDGFKSQTRKAHGKSAQIACEGTANIRTVASLTREEDLLKQYSQMLDIPMRAGYHNAIFGSLTYGIASSINYLANALSFWYGVHLFIEGEYDQFRFFAVFMAVLFGAMSSGRVFAYAPDITKAKVSAEAVMELIESSPEIDAWSNNGEKLENAKGHIKFSKVFFRYPTRSNVPVLRGLNLEINPGQFAALVGPSGCGKSTTVGLIERFYDVLSGKIEIDGIDISNLNVNNLREHISLVSQEPSLYDMTIKENILFGCRLNQKPTQEDIERVCKEANIHEFIVTLPEGYNTPVGNKGTQLSGGQKQRIAIARALIRNPKILLLDEATSALDSESEKVVQAALDKAAKGRTTLAIAHRLSTIQHADIIFVIKDGKVVEQGTHQVLLAKKGIYNDMVQEQCLGSV